MCQYGCLKDASANYQSISLQLADEESVHSSPSTLCEGALPHSPKRLKKAIYHSRAKKLLGRFDFFGELALTQGPPIKLFEAMKQLQSIGSRKQPRSQKKTHASTLGTLAA